MYCGNNISNGDFILILFEYNYYTVHFHSEKYSNDIQLQCQETNEIVLLLLYYLMSYMVSILVIIFQI